MCATGLRACRIAFVSLLFAPALAWADDGGSTWQHRVDIVTTTGFFGYRPGKVLSSDGEATFVGADEQTVRTGVRGRLTLVGEWLEFDLEPYTVIPAEQVRVNLAGIETSLVAPFAPGVKVGIYHHSSHNFSDGKFGWGINLNALVVDATLLGGTVPLFGDDASYRLRFLGHWYWSHDATPYVLTPATVVAASNIGSSSWRAGLRFDGTHPGGATECAVDVTGGEDGAPASARGECALLFRLGSRFFGSLGEHVYAGPFFGYGINFSRVDEFGRHTGYVGVRLDLLFADTRSFVRRGL